MRALIRLVCLLAAAGTAAAAGLDLTAVRDRVDSQAAVTSGRIRSKYVALQRALAKPDRAGIVDDFARLRAAARAVEGPLSADAALAAAVAAALLDGQSALADSSTQLVQLAAALEAEHDRARCGAVGADARRLADRAAAAREAGRDVSCASLARRAAARYEAGVALATKLLARQDERQPAWSVPLHDLGGALLSVWAESGPAPAVYAAGADDGTGPLFLRMGGEGWVRIPVAGSGTLWWVTGVGDAVYASGTGGRVVRYDPATGGITDLSTGVPATLYGVWGSSEAGVWTVGGNVDGSQPRTALLHHDGVSWTEAALPAETNNRTLFKVWGAAADDVWACGQAGLLLHYDGSAWSVRSSGTFESLFTVHGAAPTISVGGAVEASIVELGGQGWAPATLPPGTETLRGVFVPAHGDAWASGLLGTVLRRTSGRWLRVTGVPSASGRDFHAVCLDDAGGVYLAGGDLTSLGEGSLFYFGPRTIPAGVFPQAKLRSHVQPVLYASCGLTGCHVAPFLSEDLDLSTAAAIRTLAVGVASRQSPLLRVLPGRPSQSYLWHKLLGTQAGAGGSGDRMPQGDTGLPQSDLDAIRAWILEGARDN